MKFFIQYIKFYDTDNSIFPTLSQIIPLVATSRGRFCHILWNEPKIVVPLHRD